MPSSNTRKFKVTYLNGPGTITTQLIVNVVGYSADRGEVRFHNNARLVTDYFANVISVVEVNA